MALCTGAAIFSPGQPLVIWAESPLPPPHFEKSGHALEKINALLQHDYPLLKPNEKCFSPLKSSNCMLELEKIHVEVMPPMPFTLSSLPLSVETFYIIVLRAYSGALMHWPWNNVPKYIQFGFCSFNSWRENYDHSLTMSKSPMHEIIDRWYICFSADFANIATWPNLASYFPLKIDCMYPCQQWLQSSLFHLTEEWEKQL